MHYNDDVLNGSQYAGINDLISVSDFLVTDYSGCMFDGFKLQTKTILYALDLQHYVSNERGLYFDIRNLPSPLCESMDELISCVQSFDDAIYEEKRKLFVQEIGYYDSNGPEVVANRILHEIFG